MLISENETIANVRSVRPIGKVTAVSPWRAVRGSVPSLDNERMLSALIRRAEDVDADAIVALSYEVEPFVREGGIVLERTCVEGLAVRVLMAV